MSQKKMASLARGIFAIFALALTLPLAAASSYKILHEFTWAKQPTGNLVRDAAGNLYGTTYDGAGPGCGGSGCGAVWKLASNPNGTWTISILHVFTGSDGANPAAGLVFDTAGNLYGTTIQGGNQSYNCLRVGQGCGVVWKLGLSTGGSWTYNILHVFSGADGANPLAGLTFDGAGNLYGTTEWGGLGVCNAPVGCGTVFKLAPNPDGTWTESVLYSFTSGPDGGNPEAGLILDAVGNLYGTTPLGGTGGGRGVVFKLAPNPDGTWTESVLYAFTGGSDGDLPVAGLAFDRAGNLYGTTEDGGASGCFGTCGVVFTLARNPDGTWTESVLYSFKSGAGGFEPAAGLVFDAAGNLYGTTVLGGYFNSTRCPNGCGVVFKLAPSSSGWRETVIHAFSGSGMRPGAPLIFDPAGNLYGSASSGTCSNGLVFEITP